LPLHVFEDRYRVLVRELLELPAGRPRRFGVIAIREGSEVGVDSAPALYDVGCAADLERVEAHADGSYDISTTGCRRFRLLELDTTSRPYFVGVVNWLEEPLGAAAPLVEPVRQALRDYIAALAATTDGEFDVPEPPTEARLLSNLVGAAVLADLPDKQRLLAAPDTASRLADELIFLRREQAVLARLAAVPAPQLARIAPSLN
jgi:Lon protease-like protein